MPQNCIAHVRPECQIGSEVAQGTKLRAKSSPLPHLLPRLHEFLNRSRTRKVSRPDPADVVGASVEILNGGRSHHREPVLEVSQFFPGQNLVGTAWPSRHKSQSSRFVFCSLGAAIILNNGCKWACYWVLRKLGVIGCMIGCHDPACHSPDHPGILSPIAELDEFKGAWRALGILASEHLSALRRVATIESIGASTRIEGSKLSDREVEKLLSISIHEMTRKWLATPKPWS